MYFAFRLCGALSGLIMAAGDLLLDLKGKGNRKLGRLQLIDSSWVHMDERRFRLSILLAMIGSPLQVLGCTAMAHQLAASSPRYALVFWIVCIIGLCGTFFIHTLLCLFPILYKTMQPNRPLEEIDALICKLFGAVRIPFRLQYLCILGVAGILIIVALFRGMLPLSPWYSLLTAPVLTLIGMGLRAAKPNMFYDLPGIVMPSLGLGSIGLLAALSIL